MMEVERRQRKMQYPSIISLGFHQWLILSLLLADNLKSVFSKPTTLKPYSMQDRIRGVPDLGRGYSTTTNTFLSSCLNVHGSVHEDSYNYEYYFTDFTRGDEETSRNMLSGKISKSFGYKKIKAVLASNKKYENKVTGKKKYSVAVTMRIERNFASLYETSNSDNEGSSNSAFVSIDPHAVEMIESGEFINFFMACGPSYVRSIHRAQEITAILSFEATERSEAQSFSDALRLFALGNRGAHQPSSLPSAASGIRTFDFITFDAMDPNFDDNDIKSSLSIEILGFGLGLNSNSKETLVATSLDDFNRVMKFGFDSMAKSNSTQDTNDHAGIGHDIGMISEIEIAPWVDSAEFLRIIDVESDTIMISTPRALVENSAQDGTCSADYLLADNYGKCCEIQEIVNVTSTGEIRCESKQAASPIIMKENLAINAEFVSMLGASAREKLRSISTLGQCAQQLRVFPKHYDYTFLQSSSNAGYDDSLEMSYTVKELKAALDPNADLSILSMVADEIDEYFEMFYYPCLSALYGVRLGKDEAADSSYFMVQPWYNLEECKNPTCFDPSMAWDRKNGGGCVEGILARTDDSAPIPDKRDRFCSMQLDANSGRESCKYDYVTNANTFVQMDQCRMDLPQVKDGRGRPTPVSMSYLMENFCMPRLVIDEDPADDEKMAEVDLTWDKCMTKPSSSRLFDSISPATAKYE